jgi:hypothetical protein
VQSNDPNLQVVQTTDPIVFHAYDPAVQTTYVSQLPARNDPANGILAPNYTTPVGTVRPDGGAPTTTAAAAADPLNPIPVVLTPADASATATDTQLQAAVTMAASADELGSPTGDPGSDPSARPAAPLAAEGSAPMPILVGGPGVAQLADLGRTGGSPGAIPNVFAVNYQVIAPTGRSVDAPVSDYLCRTPFAGDSCHARGAHER